MSQNNRNLIVLAEDDQYLRPALEATLLGDGYEVKSYENGALAYNAINSMPKEELDRAVLLTDNDMPRLTGIALIEKLHADNIKLPIMLHSGGIFSDELSQGTTEKRLESMQNEGKLDHFQAKGDDLNNGINAAINHFNTRISVVFAIPSTVTQTITTVGINDAPTIPTEQQK